MSEVQSLIADLPPEKLRLLGQRLKDKKLQADPLEPAMPPLVPRPQHPGGPPVSSQQLRLWLLAQLAPRNPFYSNPSIQRLEGRLEVAALHAAINAVVRRQEALRTTFSAADGEPLQVISPVLTVPLPVVDLRHLAPAARRVEAEKLADEEVRQPFDLATGPLLRATLLRLTASESWLLLIVHHIVADAWSMSILVREMMSFYEALPDRRAVLPELSLKYADFAYWQRSWLRGEALKRLLGFWKKQLAGSPPVLELPADRLRPAVQAYRGDLELMITPKALRDDLHALSRSRKVTLFLTLLSAFKTLLLRYTGQQDMVVGAPVAYRNWPEIENLIGFFANMLVLRSDLCGDPCFEELLGRMRKVVAAAFKHQHLPFEKLVEELQPERSLSYSPIFQVVFSMLHFPSERPDGEPACDLTWTQLRPRTSSATMDLALYIADYDEGLGLSFEYNTELFDRCTILRLAGHFQNLLQGVVAKPSERLSRLPLLAAAEHQQLLVEWNNTAAEHPRDGCLHELFEDRVRRQPAATAVMFERAVLSYGELNRRANQLARHLRGLGVGPEVPVALCVESSVERILGILGILKAGGAYVPLDPAYPQDRRRFILEDAQARVLLTQERLLAGMGEWGGCVLCPDRDGHEIATRSPENLAGTTTPENLAYVIYTSGSTGKPKGVAVSHRAITNRLLWMQEVFPLTAEDILLQKTPYSFDASIWEIFVPLFAGARLVVAEPGGHQDSAYLLATIAERGVSILQLVPSMLSVFLEQEQVAAGCRRLRRVFCGGEALPGELAQRFFARLGGELCNIYGPTEAAIDASFHPCPPQLRQEIMAIGRPLANVQIYLLDRRGRPVPPGVVGELYISGAGLARGYFGQSALSAERFLPHPWSRLPGGRLYRTGDLTRYAADGTIEFVGRIDHQIKLRGFRIELGEIESQLLKHRGIRDAVVVEKSTGAGEKLLCAYFVAATEPLATELRNHLASSLPEYMIPTAFIALPELPRTPSGKLDRRALPEPEVANMSVGIDYVAPANEIEAALIEIWQEVLGIAGKIGARHDFFDLGGHSLTAVQVLTGSQQKFDVDLSLQDLFRHPTVAGLALVIDEKISSAQSPQLPPLKPRTQRRHKAPLSFSQRRLWFMDQLEPDNPFYNTVSAVRITGRLNLAVLKRAFNEIIQRHEVLRTVFMSEGGHAVQVIQPPWSVKLPLVDLCALPEDGRRRRAWWLVSQETLVPFDLSRGPLLQCRLVRLAEHKHVIMLALHHIVSDGWSAGVLVRELVELYDSFSQNKPSPLPDLPVQYADFAFWQRQWLQGEVLEAEISYWKKQLAGAPDLIKLPTDYPRPPVQSYRGARQPVEIPAELRDRLIALSRQEGGTLFMIIMAGFQTLLHLYSGEDDIVIGSPISYRNWAEIEGLIGFFVNTLVYRVDFSGNPTFRELFARVRKTALGAFAHQHLPFEKLVEELRPKRNPAYQPVFQVGLTLQPPSRETVEAGDIAVSPFNFQMATTQFDLNLTLIERAHSLAGYLEYCADLFDDVTITWMREQLQQILQQIEEDPEIRMSELKSRLARSDKQRWAVAHKELEQASCLNLRKRKRKVVTTSIKGNP